MVKFTPERIRALDSLYKSAATRRSQSASDIAEHAIGLALSDRRADAFLARNAIRNARCTQLRRLRHDVQHCKQLVDDPGGAEAALDRAMARDTVSKAAQPPSIERTLLIRDSLNMLLDEVERQLGARGRIVAERYQDEVAEVAADLGCAQWRVKDLRAAIRQIADRLAADVRP